MIRVSIQKDKICSVLLCDICKQPIKKVEEGLLAMPNLFNWEDGPPPDFVEFVHVHKGSCQRICEAQSANYGDLELRDHLFHLLGNVGWRPKHAAIAKEFAQWELCP